MKINTRINNPLNEEPPESPYSSSIGALPLILPLWLNVKKRFKQMVIIRPNRFFIVFGYYLVLELQTKEQPLLQHTNPC